MVLTVLRGIGKLLLKDKKDTVGVVIKKVTGGVEAITGVVPTVSKKLSEVASAQSITGWAKRMQSKLKNK